jgi:ABC-type multidrug transport system ATPase subunit
MKQKLALCCALIHKPTVLFLDEPTTGVDPVSRKEFWEMLKRLKEQNITILVSTPYMDEATKCDRIALMHNGKILSIDTPASISASYPDKLFAVKTNKMSTLLKALSKFEKALNSYAFGQYAHVSIKNNEVNIEKELRQYLENAKMESIEIKPIRASVEDYFIKLLK